jgi:hypothetical protein
MSFVPFEDDPHPGMANLAIGLAVMTWVLAGADRTVVAVLIVAGGMTALVRDAELPDHVPAAFEGAERETPYRGTDLDAQGLPTRTTPAWSYPSG